MAAAEYYYGTATAQNPPTSNPYPPQPNYGYQQQSQTPPQQQQHYGTPPPSYSPYPPQQQPQVYSPQPQYGQNGKPPTSAPYPHTLPPAQGYALQPPPQQSGYLSAPLQPQRSHSQPPRVHFAKEDEVFESDSSDGYYSTDSEDSRRRRHRHRKHRRSDRDRSRSSSQERERERERGHSSRRHGSSHRRKERKDRETFLGAGVGGLIGDAIVPGLGTAAGLLLGGYGGRKHADKRTRHRSQSEAAADREYYGHRRRQGSGWDEDSATFRKGHAVR